MIIEKYVKGSNNTYKVVIDKKSYTLYDDVIIKFNLLFNKNIDDELLNEISAYNYECSIYYLCVKYIEKKFRTELEIREYLLKKDIESNIIDNVVEKLYLNNYLNDEIYVKTFINDSLYLSNDGPEKIKLKLDKVGIDGSLVLNELENYDEAFWNDRINKYIAKKVKLNHTYSKDMLKGRLLNELVNLGYDNEVVSCILENYDIIDDDVMKREYLKAKRLLSNKYSGEELDNKIKERLYRKGFRDIGE